MSIHAHSDKAWVFQPMVHGMDIIKEEIKMHKFTNKENKSQSKSLPNKTCILFARV